MLALAAAVIAAASCGGSDATDAVWASGVDVVVASVTDTYDAGDVYRAAAFYSAGGTLDLEHWGLGRGATPDEIVRMVEQVWFFDNAYANVDAEHVFVTPDGAMVWWLAYDLDGFQSWMQAYAFAGNRVASKAFAAIEVPYTIPTEDEEWLLQVVDRYLEVWDGSGAVSPAEVYAPDAEVRDDMTGLVLDGIDAVAAGVGAGPPIEPGPGFPAFRYEADGHLEAVVLVMVDDVCPRLEARRLVFIDGMIAYELRATHVPSARRCGGELPDGWWTSFEPPGDLVDNVTEVVDAAGRTVELVNAEPVHNDFTRWLIDRFVAGGLRPPRAVRLWFPPSPDCVEQIGFARRADERYGDEHTIVLCFSHDRIRSDTTESGWRTPAIVTGLHELAHLWMWEHLDAATEEAFVARVGLESWRDAATSRDQGIEHAAYTIAWGLAGTADARYPMLPARSCEELEARYEILTGRAPITSCEEGWSQ